MEKVTLNEDIYSCFDINNSNRKPYAKKGDEVKIIHESLPALIVENMLGERFTVNIDKVIYKPNNTHDKEINQVRSTGKENAGESPKKIIQKKNAKRKSSGGRGLELPGLY